MNKQHTPGPWMIAEHGWTTDIMAAPCGVGRLVMETFDAAGTAMRPTKAERQANARLIAAAPDLLAALEMVADLPGFNAEDYYGVKVLETIARARGRE